MPKLTEKILAWSVHLFTASGLLAGFMSILAINDRDWREAMLWLFASLIIDGVDGTFARLFKVKTVLPHIDGRTIDYVIDFATYAIIPAYFFHQAELAPDLWNLPCTFLILLVSALYYGKEGMVSEDMYFVGFPVMWNMVVLYLFFVVPLPAWGNALAVVFFAILHFVPLKFSYPSRGIRFRWLTLAVTSVFMGAIGVIVWIYPERSRIWTGLAIFTALYYGFITVVETIKRD